ncbi:hypothetical protein DPMN_078929, partial [Dreissena polymorpha]
IRECSALTKKGHYLSWISTIKGGLSLLLVILFIQLIQKMTSYRFAEKRNRVPLPR